MKGDQSDQGDFYRSTLAAIKDLGYEELLGYYNDYYDAYLAAQK